MTYMLGRFTGYPPHVFESGIAATIKDSSFRLYFFLTRVSDQRSSREFTIPDSSITQQAGVSARSLTSARRELQTIGWVQCERAPGRGYLYRMCDPTTGKPFPGDPKTKAPYKKRIKEPVADVPKHSPELQCDDAPFPSNSDCEDDTKFDFGFNWDKQKLRE